MNTAVFAGLLMFTNLLASSSALAQERFHQVNLVSNQAGEALRTDANLVNPWGLVPGPTGVFWVANQGTGTSTLYQPDGTPVPLVVTIPGGDPTGVVVTDFADSSFRIPAPDSTQRAVFIFVTLDGAVAAWSPTLSPNTAALQVGSDPGSAYTGAAVGGTASAPRLFAADFAGNEIDVYDRDFDLLTTTGNWTDPNLPAGFAPFNVASIGGQIYVAYAMVNTSNGQALPGAGLGYVSVFDEEGTFVRRVLSGGELDAPWAMVMAPSGFGDFGGDLLVGNFGDGTIHAYSANNGSHQGALLDTLGNEIVLEGLWGLWFGSTASGSAVAQRLYFAAGVDDETGGLFGYLAEVQEPGEPGPPSCENRSRTLAFWNTQCGSGDSGFPGRGHGSDQGQGKKKGHFKDFPGKGKHLGHFKDSGGGGNPPVPTDSLNALLGCITSASSPNAFGSGGCFTAGCELLGQDSDGNPRLQAAQELLAVRLNLCAGLVCDSLVVDSVGTGAERHALRVGAIADSLDELLCNGGTPDSVYENLTEFLRRVNGRDLDALAGSEGSRGLQRRAIDVRTVGGTVNRGGSAPIRFTLSTTSPSMVELRVYDAAGRLVAQPLKKTMVAGTIEVQWDGRNGSGGFVPAGNYFYRATGGSEAASGRVVIIR